jgi:hypothetical protein
VDGDHPCPGSPASGPRPRSMDTSWPR